MRVERARLAKDRGRSAASPAGKPPLSRSGRGVAAGLPRFLRHGLPVSRPGDRAEREADRAADHVAAEDRSAGPSATEGVSPGTGAPLPRGLRERMESRFDADFSRVRIHTDAQADAAARLMGARAFTAGTDVVFAAGQYSADTSGGRALIAHELAHVVQQAGGSGVRGESQSPRLSAAEPSIQRAVDTLGGTWDTTKYDVVNNGTVDVGVDINLNFTPKDPVDAELIGLTQTANTIVGGSPSFSNDTVKKRSIRSGADKGVHIDRLAEYGNPLYATDRPSPGDTLASTPVYNPVHSPFFWGQHGWHYRDIAGALQHQDAILKDKPQYDPPGKNSSQVFETTTLAVKGTQEGTYYGSVSWGWKTDASGTFSKLPLSIVAAGVPSATFMRAAELWNTNKTSTGSATIPLPTSSLPSGTKLPSARSTGELVIRIADINAELARMSWMPAWMSSGTDKTNLEFEKKALEFELASRADKPTMTLADQEKAASLLATPDLVKRANALPMEILALAPSPARTNKELEQEAVGREMRKRKLVVTVHVHETEDIAGSDNVYVSAGAGFASTSTSVVDLNDGEEHDFVIPLSAIYPAPPLIPTYWPIWIWVYDQDWPDANDLMFRKSWAWADLPATDTQSRDDGKYEVRVQFAQLR